MELLAPAGDEGALRAAVCAGADAAYLGFQAFSARASATNFDGEQLARAIQYAHLYGVRVYVTVNTLVKQRELEAAYKALQTIAYARADAVIVQDLGVAALTKQYFPTLEIHASTQMALHNATGMRWAKAQGINRVVLARECSLPEITLAAQQGVGIEVFIHGALCSGVSGQCLMSSMAGGRSGNRGRCAQPCRQILRLGGYGGALLSLRDLCLREQLPQLVRAGVSALKIEGRLKRPEYVAVVVDSYRRAIDAMERGAPPSTDQAEREWLMQAFHRGGFTAGHAGGDQDGAVADPSRVGHGGLPMGRVVTVKNNLATVKLARALHDGDGLQLRGIEDADLRYAGKDKAAGEEAVLRLRPGQVARPGDEVARLTDVRQMAFVQKLCEKKPIPVMLHAVIELGNPLRLTLCDGTRQVTVEGPCPQRAQTRASTVEEVRKQLGRLGDSPFALTRETDLTLELQSGALFVPVSSLNALRREAVAALMKARTAAFFGLEKEQRLEQQEPRSLKLPVPVLPQPLGKDILAVSFSDPAMGQALREAGANRLLFAPWDLRPQALEAAFQVLPPDTWLELPPYVSEDSLQDVLVAMRAHGTALGGAVVGSVGQLGTDFGLPVALGAGVPITNHMVLEVLAQSRPSFYILWPEWSFGEQKELLAATSSTGRKAPEALLTMYGRQPLMLLHHCMNRVHLGLSRQRSACNFCQGGQMACGAHRPEMIDRKGYRFPLTRTVTRAGCLINVLGALPTDLRKQDDKRRALDAGMLLRFTTEEAEEQQAITKVFAALLKGEPVPANPMPTTAGHLLRGVE